MLRCIFSGSFTVFTLVYVKIIPFHIELLYASVIIGKTVCYKFKNAFYALKTDSSLRGGVGCGNL